MALNRDGWICRQCGKPANEVDHIIDRAIVKCDAMDNLQSLCKSCHSRKTGGRRGSRVVDSRRMDSRLFGG